MLTWPDYTKRQHDTVDFFLARRRVPAWAACLSFLATEISAVTIISVPATAYSENWEYGVGGPASPFHRRPGPVSH